MRRALVIGVTIESTINDAIDTNTLLESRGYRTLLLIRSEATCANIKKALLWLSKSKNCYLHFSGHSKGNALLCYHNEILELDFIKDFLPNNAIVVLDCCNVAGLLKYTKSERVTLISSNSYLAYDYVIDGKRRGLLTYYLLKTLESYNYSISIEDLTKELNGRLLRYNQSVSIVSSKKEIRL